MAEKPYPSPSKLSEQLQNLCWRIAVELRAIYNTVQTKISQDDADKLYLGIKGKAVSATTADSATKATQDGSGNVITQTYAKTSSIPTAMKGATASVAGSAGTVPAPAAGANAKFLRGDGTWQAVVIPSKVSELTNDKGFITTTTPYLELNPGTSASHGGYIDFHYNGSTADYTARIIEGSSGAIQITAAKGLTLNGKAVATGVIPTKLSELENDLEVSTTEITTTTYSVTEAGTDPQSYALGDFAHVLVFVNSVLAVDGDTYGITGGTTLQFWDVLPVGTEVVVIKFVTSGSVRPTPTFAIDSALSTTSTNAVQNKVVQSSITSLQSSITSLQSSITSLQSSIDQVYAKYSAEVG